MQLNGNKWKTIYLIEVGSISCLVASATRVTSAENASFNIAWSRVLKEGSSAKKKKKKKKYRKNSKNWDT